MQLEDSGSKLQKTEKSVFTNTMNISHCSSSLAEIKQSDSLMHCSECDHKLNNDAHIQPVKQMHPWCIIYCTFYVTKRFKYKYNVVVCDVSFVCDEDS